MSGYDTAFDFMSHFTLLDFFMFGYVFDQNIYLKKDISKICFRKSASVKCKINT